MLTDLIMVVGLMALALVVWAMVVVIKSLGADCRNRVLADLVAAAEQIYGPGNGEAKRRYVLERIRARGWKYDRDKLEAEVYWLRAAPHTKRLSVWWGCDPVSENVVFNEEGESTEEVA